ncbi:MAG TPA: porphobilinogen synthase, partial [Candidatus Acidoferrales bacterium]|nr:porphobilinogen synthase [Candidatus Acidoferrales bacterium]
MSYPSDRPRRLRRTEAIRGLVRETRLSTSGMFYPMFICSGSATRQEIRSMPGIRQQSVDCFLEEAREVEQLGIPGVMLFGIPENKDAEGSGAWSPDGPVPQAIRAVREANLSLLVAADVCLCEYTDHGHCGVIEGEHIVNDPSVERLAGAALAYARAGADIVAPSDMMDGRVGAIRRMLDDNDHEDTIVMSYAAKYCSGLYGPFREAAESTPKFGDRRSYQMDPANAREALREVELDVEEGADIVMVKPAMPYLDVIRRVRDTFSLPVAAYNVSGEYSMVKAAAANGCIEEK